MTPGCVGGRDRDVDHLDLGVVEHLLQRVEDAGDAAEPGDLVRRGEGPRGQPDDAEARLGIGDEVAVADDEARPHHADPHVEALRGHEQVAEVCSIVGGHGEGRSVGRIGVETPTPSRPPILRDADRPSRGNPITLSPGRGCPEGG